MKLKWLFTRYIKTTVLCMMHIQLTLFEVLQLMAAEVSLKGLEKVPCFESTEDRANTVLKNE